MHPERPLERARTDSVGVCPRSGGAVRWGKKSPAWGKKSSSARRLSDASAFAREHVGPALAAGSVDGQGGPDTGLTATVDIWLILPVVICLSQRLSHACLSTNFNTVKLRMAH